MEASRGNVCAWIFFGWAILCAWNPEQLPARHWFNGVLESVVGWMR